MKKVKYTFRLAIFLIAVSLIIYLSRKTNDNTQSIAEFKVRMFENVRVDSVDAQHKLELLRNATSKFMANSTRVRDGLHYLAGLFVVLVIVELSFIAFERRNKT